jgi:hypothetical protein
MQTPYIYELLRNNKSNKSILRENLKEKQIFENNVWSHDILIMSLKKSLTDNIPWI